MVGFSYRRNIYGDVYDACLHFNLLMMKQDPEKYLIVVVGHEVAHMVAECIGEIATKRLDMARNGNMS